MLTLFEERHCKKLFLVCGASLGAHVAAEILQLNPDFAEYAMIESLKAYQYQGVRLKLFMRLGKSILKRCAKTNSFMAGTYKQKYASDDTKATISCMSETTLDNIMIESGNYRIRQLPIRISSKTLILYGSKERKECIVNTDILKQQITDCRVMEIQGYSHGELAIGNPDRHLDYLGQLVGKEDKNGRA